jgi:hypothetical protein
MHTLVEHIHAELAPDEGMFVEGRKSCIVEPFWEEEIGVMG